MKNREEVVKEMQAVVEQMRLDDIEENPDCENELIDAMEDKRLEADCEFLRQEQKRLEN